MGQLSSSLLSMLTQALITIRLQCIKIKLHFPDYQFDSKTASLVVPSVFSTNCNDFPNFWYNRNGIGSNDTDLITQMLDSCMQVINPLSSAMSSGLQFEVYEHFVYYIFSTNTNANNYTTTQQNYDTSNLTINVVENGVFLIHHLLLYSISTYCDSVCWFNKLSNFDSFLNKTHSLSMNNIMYTNEILILSEIVFYIERYGCSHCQWWIDTTSFMYKQCGAVIQVTISPTNWRNENQTALLTYSADVNALSAHAAVKYSHI